MPYDLIADHFGYDAAASRLGFSRALLPCLRTPESCDRERRRQNGNIVTLMPFLLDIRAQLPIYAGVATSSLI